jgi:hypothetical protein
MEVRKINKKRGRLGLRRGAVGRVYTHPLLPKHNSAVVDGGGTACGCATSERVPICGA